MAIVRFMRDEPVTVRFAEAGQGKQVVSERYGSVEYLHKLDNGDTTYLSEACEDALKAVGMAPGEPITICRRELPGAGGRKKTHWEVTRGNQAPPQVQGSPNHNVPAVQSGNLSTQPDSIASRMAALLIAAGRATREAEQVLGAEGGSVRFDSRDVASLATTLLIQALREGAIAPAAQRKPQERAA